jgi:hypothetical protein
MKRVRHIDVTYVAYCDRCYMSSSLTSTERLEHQDYFRMAHPSAIPNKGLPDLELGSTDPGCEGDYRQLLFF